MKVIIAGGRDFDKGFELVKAVDNFRDENNITEVVCGMAKGADMMGLSYAKYNEIPVKRFPANWNKYGKSAGYIRNKEMAEYADALIAFWDGKSPGTKMMIELATQKGLIVNVVKY